MIIQNKYLFVLRNSIKCCLSVEDLVPEVSVFFDPES